MTTSRGRKLAAAGALLGAIALAPGNAWADGGQYPSGAPTITVGVPNVGDTRFPNSSPRQDYYRLPSLLAGDVITIAGRTITSSTAVRLCLASGVDDFDWDQKGCNLSPYQRLVQTGSRLTFRTSSSSSAAYLRAYYSSSDYQFTVEKIQRLLSLSISAPPEIERNGRLSVRTVLTNGQGVVDGHLLSLTVTVGGRNYTYTARTSGGRAVFQLNLPADAGGKSATLRASSSSSSATYTGAAASQGINIVK